MKTIICLFSLIVPALAMATPKVNVITCHYLRNSVSADWAYVGWIAGEDYYDLADGEYHFDHATWTPEDGECMNFTGTNEDAVDVGSYIYEGKRVENIDESCVATGEDVKLLAGGRKVLRRGESFDQISTRKDQSQLLSHHLFTPYSGLKDVFKFADDYCPRLQPKSSGVAPQCALSETGKQYFSAMNLTFCDVDTCLTFTRLNGEQDQERMKFQGCGGRWCIEKSKNFSHVFPSAGRDAEYVSNIAGDQVYLICR